MEPFFKQIGTAFGVVIVGIVAVCLIVARSLVPGMASIFVLGLSNLFNALFTALIIVIVLTIPSLIILGVVYLRQRHYQDIGQFGTIASTMFGKQEVIAPLAIASPRERVKVELVVPTVAELLKENMLGTESLLLGYDMEGKPYWGSWNDIRTLAVAGKGRSGKTVTMFFLILQAILNDCIVWVADPHAGKKSSITSLLQPLSQWVRFARTDNEIADMTASFIDVMEYRLEELAKGQSPDMHPMLLVTDEFTRMIESNEQVYDAVVNCAQQYAGVNGYAMIAGHEWTGKEIVKLRRALHAVFIHRLDEGYAKYLINNSKYARLAEKLHTGFSYLRDTEGDIHELKTPLGVVSDAETVARMLAQLAGVDEQKQIVSPDETPRFDQAETERFTDILSLEAPKETKRFDKKEEIKRLRGLGFNQSNIIQAIWHCKPGESQVYRDALAEYKSILESIVREVQV